MYYLSGLMKYLFTHVLLMKYTKIYFPLFWLKKYFRNTEPECWHTKYA